MDDHDYWADLLVRQQTWKIASKSEADAAELALRTESTAHGPAWARKRCHVIGLRSPEWWRAAYGIAYHLGHRWAWAAVEPRSQVQAQRLVQGRRSSDLAGIDLTECTLGEVAKHLAEIEVEEGLYVGGLGPADAGVTTTGRLRWWIDDLEKKITIEICRPSTARVSAIKAEDEVYDAYVAKAVRHGDDARETKHALAVLEAARAALDRLASDGQCALRWVAPLEEGAWVPELLKLGPSEARHRKVLTDIIQALGRPVPAELASENADES